MQALERVPGLFQVSPRPSRSIFKDSGDSELHSAAHNSKQIRIRSVSVFRGEMADFSNSRAAQAAARTGHFRIQLQV